MRLARIAWLIIASTATAMLLYTLFTLFVGWWNTPPDARSDHAIFGLSFHFWAVYYTSGAGLEMLSWVIVGWLIFWKKSSSLFALLFSLGFILVGIFHLDGVTLTILANYLPAAMPIAEFFRYLGAVLLSSWFAFPNGSFVPRGSRWLALFWVTSQTTSYVFPGTIFDIGSWPVPLPLLINDGLLLIMFAILIYRYRRQSSPIERQQIKWVVTFGMVAAFWYVFGEVHALIYSQPDFLADHIIRLISYITYALLALSIGISILRYRLWEIDVLIRRTLIYTIVTSLLAIFYFALVTVAGRILQPITGRIINTQLSIVLSTLATAALFTPLRRRIQTTIDRRFYRSHYDIQRVIQNYGNVIRDEVDLDKLGVQLESVVHTALSPESISLSIIQPANRKIRNSEWF
jgi:hypothetical protein